MKKRKISFDTFYSILSPTQKANYALSLSWKMNCSELFKKAKDEKSFSEAVKWCGVKGNVSRTVSNDDFPAFSHDLYKSKSSIIDGTYDLDSTLEYSGRKPIGWVNKICHIINPKEYPIVFDNYVKMVLQPYDISNYVEEAKRDSQTKIELYKVDSAIWASKTR